MKAPTLSSAVVIVALSLIAAIVCGLLFLAIRSAFVPPAHLQLIAFAVYAFTSWRTVLGLIGLLQGRNPKIGKGS